MKNVWGPGLGLKLGSGDLTNSPGEQTEHGTVA